MRQDFFTFEPQFKGMVAGNHKPVLRRVDNAMPSRILLVPWSVTIPPDEQDRQLFEKLQEERPAILRWMIDGTSEWLRLGLRPPKLVTDATAAYLDSEDLLNLWLTERCDQGRTYTAAVVDAQAAPADEYPFVANRNKVLVCEAL